MLASGRYCTIDPSHAFGAVRTGNPTVIRIVETAVRRRLLLTILVLVSAACGSETATGSEDPAPSSASVPVDSTTTTSPERTLTGGLTIPPPLVVRNGSTSVEVKPTSFCWAN